MKTSYSRKLLCSFWLKVSAGLTKCLRIYPNHVSFCRKFNKVHVMQVKIENNFLLHIHEPFKNLKNKKTCKLFLYQNQNLFLNNQRLSCRKSIYYGLLEGFFCLYLQNIKNSIAERVK